MDRSRADVVAELTEVGEPLGKESEYRTLAAAFEAVACMIVETCPQNLEAELAVIRLRESLFWGRRSMGRAGAREKHGLEAEVDDEGGLG